ncbi:MULTISPECIES: hypothetical protein [unclassified Chryseobacterium]|uniref:hypothetical protein n=1 Tax=unclassified Chryseobacterium TaxID=2593645 RepID=UPI00226A6169|nr:MULTISPECIES: hypothetical protein [unclassified Chryseobacterium]
MKDLLLTKGKKLNKKQLKMIAGGLLDCMQPIVCTDPPCEIYGPDDPRSCSQISIGCAQKICRPL